MVSNSENDLIGEELIRVLLETFHVELIFNNYGVQLFNVFNIQDVNKFVTIIDGKNKVGDISKLWNLIGFSLVGVKVEEKFSLIFNNGSILSIDRIPDKNVGTIQTLDLKFYDEF